VTIRVLAGVLAVGFLSAACGGGSGSLTGLPVAGAGGGGSALGNLAQFGTTSPPPALEPVAEEVECPPVSIEAGGAAIRLQAGGSNEGVRSQVSITDVARECAAGPGGSVVIKVGAEGRSLIGPAGSAGGHFATLRITLRKGDAVLATRTARVGANVGAGQGQAPWTHVEQGILLPASALATRGDIDVFVSLSPGGPAPRTSRRRG
jgi:hypothetical protein